MALSTLRFGQLGLGLSKGIFLRQSYVVATMATNIAPPNNKTTQSAFKEMQDFWNKNLDLKRPNSPWIIYKPHLPMLTSFCHRVTGIAMGVAFYAFSITTFVAPGDFPSYVEFVKNLQLPQALLFPMKTVVAFPLVYHYINGIRHLTWDAGHGYVLKTQYKSGAIIMSTSILVSALLASVAYW